MGLLLLLVTGRTANAQELLNEFTVRHWNVEDGLPEAAILSIQQMPDGYLWLTTPHQVVRFDGVKFVTWPGELWPSNRPAEIRQLYLDHDGNPWLCGDNTLLRHDGQGWQVVPLSGGNSLAAGTVIRVETPDGPMQVEWKREFFRLGEAAASGEVLAVSNEGVYRFDGHKMILLPMPAATGTMPPAVTAATIDHRGTAWFAVDGRLVKWDQGIYTPEIIPEGLGLQNFFKIVAGEGDSLWAQDKNSGRRVRQRGGQWEPVSSAGTRLSAVAESGGGTTSWVGSVEGLHRYERGQWRELRSSETDTPTDTRCLALSQDGCVWVGTSWGLYRLQPRSVNLLPTALGSTGRNPVAALWPASNSNLWAGVNRGGLFVGLPGTFRAGATNPVLQTAKISALLQAADEKLWIGTHGWHLWYRQADGYERELYLKEGQESRNITCLLEDAARRIWVGTREGLLFVDSQNRLVRATEKRVPILALSQGTNGTLWVGTQGGGLWEMKQGKVTRQYHQADGLPSETVRLLHTDAEGVLWLGTPTGVGRWAGGQKNIFGAEQGMPHIDIRQMLDDGAGHLWLGTPNELLQVAKSEFAMVAAGRQEQIHFQIFDANDGLTSELSTADGAPLSVRTPDGRLWFCAKDGLALVTPTQVRIPAQAVCPEVDEIRTSAGWVRRLSPWLPGKSHYPEGSEHRMVLPPRSPDMEITFAMPLFADSSGVRFQAWLEGYDAGWSPPFARHSVNYRHLTAGNYQFRLRASTDGSAWRELDEPLVFTVGAFFYETAWFKTLAGTGALGVTGFVAAFLVRRRAQRKMRVLEQEKARDMAVANERTRIARDIHDELGATLTQIAMMSDISLREAEAGRTVSPKLMDIFTRARNATRQLDETVWAINPGNDTLENLVTYLCGFAEDHLKLAGLRFRLDAPELLPTRQLHSSQRHHLFLAAKEALHNAVKHSQATEVWLRVRLADERLHLLIEDNGKGSAAAKPVSGHGLGNLAQHMEQVGGVAKRTDGASGGTIVELIMPLTAAKA